MVASSALAAALLLIPASAHWQAVKKGVLIETAPKLDAAPEQLFEHADSVADFQDKALELGQVSTPSCGVMKIYHPTKCDKAFLDMKPVVAYNIWDGSSQYPGMTATDELVEDAVKTPVSLSASNSTGCYYQSKHKSFEFCHPVAVTHFKFVGTVYNLEITYKFKDAHDKTVHIGTFHAGWGKYIGVHEEGVVGVYVTYKKSSCKIAGLFKMIINKPCPPPTCPSCGELPADGNLDFNGVPASTVGSPVFAANLFPGVTIFGDRNRANAADCLPDRNCAIITDSLNPIDDPDLNTSDVPNVPGQPASPGPQGNIITLLDKGGSSDDRRGGNITFTFPCKVQIEYITLVDIDVGSQEEFAAITFERPGADDGIFTVLGFHDQMAPDMVDPATVARRVSFGTGGVTKVSVQLKSSGGVGEIKYKCECEQTCPIKH